MVETTSRGSFELSTIHPSWSGGRIFAMEQPLHNGLAQLRILLARASAAIIVVQTEFDYDGMYEKIDKIESIHTGNNPVARSEDLLAAYLRDLSAKHPALSLSPKPVLPMNVLPATRSVFPGNFPPQFGGFRLANDPLYEAIYLRLHIIEDAPELSSIFHTILGYEGIRASLIDYITRLGGYASG